jgi:hypothetical protein
MNWVKLGFSRLEIKEKKREGIIVSITRLSFVWLPLLFRDGTSCLVVSLKEHLLLPLRKRRRSLAVKMDHYYTNRLCSLGPMALFSKVLICSSKCFETGFPGPISKKVVRIPEKLWITRERTWSVFWPHHNVVKRKWKFPLSKRQFLCLLLVMMCISTSSFNY